MRSNNVAHKLGQLPQAQRYPIYMKRLPMDTNDASTSVTFGCGSKDLFIAATSSTAVVSPMRRSKL